MRLLALLFVPHVMVTAWRHPIQGLHRQRVTAPSMAFETEPTFQRLNVGSGVVRVCSGEQAVVTVPCQFAAFGRKDFGNADAPLCHVEPPEAHTPLEPLNGAVALVRRGKCSFQAKMHTAAAAGASGVILVNDEDSTFVAHPDPAPIGSQGPASKPNPRIASESGEVAPLVVVSSSAGERISTACSATEAAGEAHVMVSVTFLANDESMADALRLPLFPVLQTLLPGHVLRMRVSPGERAALQMRFKLALEGPPEGTSLPDDIGVATVAVVLVGDASTNLLATVGTLCHIDLSTLRASGTRTRPHRGSNPGLACVAPLFSSPLLSSPPLSSHLLSSPLLPSPPLSSPLLAPPRTSSPRTFSHLLSSPRTSSPLLAPPLLSSPLSSHLLSSLLSSPLLSSPLLSPLLAARLLSSPPLPSPLLSSSLPSPRSSSPRSPHPGLAPHTAGRRLADGCDSVAHALPRANPYPYPNPNPDVSLMGVTPCHMRCLVRESTPTTFGLALVVP